MNQNIRTLETRIVEKSELQTLKSYNYDFHILNKNYCMHQQLKFSVYYIAILTTVFSIWYSSFSEKSYEKFRFSREHTPIRFMV